MKAKGVGTLVGLGAAAVLIGQMKAAGPDVAVCELTGVSRWAPSVGGLTAYSVGTLSMNVGNVNLSWEADGFDHPVIGQNMFRLKDGRFEQIGQSWLKHGFCALQIAGCGACSVEGGCLTFLKPGCSDPYGSGLNGTQGGLGPKFEVNPVTGAYAWPYTADGESGDAIYKRIQVHNDDLEPSLNPGALYFMEGQYVAADDAAFGNQNNNAAYRRATVSGDPYNVGLVGGTHQFQPAIWAWKDHGLGVDTPDPDVTIVNVDVQDDGRLILGHKVSDNGDGTWHYEYAIQNLNSERGGGVFRVPVPAGVTVTNVGFHDVDYHSGEPFDGTDWGVTIGGGEVAWATQSETENANANALRWGTLYNFRFDADAPPTPADVVIELFKCCGKFFPPWITVAAQGPGGPVPVCPEDINGDGVINVLDLIDLLLCFGQSAVPGCETEDVNGDGSVNVLDLIDLLLEFGNACP